MSDKTRLTRRLEDYLEAVWLLMHEEGAARVRDIAARTDVTKSSVTAALKQLAQTGLVRYDPYQLVTLTDRGEAVARRIHRKHDAITAFLISVLDIDPETAEANACRMEHVVDDEVLHRLSLLAEFVQERPPQSDEWLERFAAYCRQHEGGSGQPAEGPRHAIEDPPEPGPAPA